MLQSIHRPDLPQVTEVVANDLCIACGACIEACPENLIHPDYSELRGTKEIKISSTSDCQGCGKFCDQVCPSIKVDFRTDKDTSLHPRLGNIKNVVNGYSPEYQFNGISSSGGVVREIITYFTMADIPVICLVQNEQGYEAGLINSTEELSNIPGSIYHSVGFYNAIPLLRESSRKCAIIALPCVMEGIDKYIQTCEPELELKIEARIGIICGWMYSDHAWQSFASAKRIKMTDITDISYRGEDKVGQLKLRTNEKVHSFNRKSFSTFSEEVDFRSSFSGVYNRLRCRLCENHTNITADISVGDAWLKKYDNPEAKISIIVSRTSKGEKILDSLEHSQKLVLSQGNPDEIIESQSLNLVLGLYARQLSRLLNSKGITTPKFFYSGSEKYSYTEEKDIESLTIKDRFYMNEELVWRSLVRRKHYFLYRLRVLVRMLPRQIRQLFSKILTILR